MSIVPPPEAPPVPTPAPDAPVTDWRSGLTGEYEPLAKEPSLASFKGQSWADVGPALVKSWVETKKLVGAKSAVPTDKSTPEEVATFRKAMGVPDAATGYQVTRPDVAIDIGWDTDAETRFLATAHQHGMTPAQVNASVAFYGAWERQKLETAREAANKIGAELRTAWGANYAAHLGRANRIIKEFGGTAVDQAFTTPGHPLNAAGRDPLFIKMMAAIGDALVEAGTVSGEGVHGLTPQESEAKVQELRAKLKALPEGHKDSMKYIDEILALQTAARGGTR